MIDNSKFPLLKIFDYDPEKVLVYDARAALLFLLPKSKLEELKACLEKPGDKRLWQDAGFDILSLKGVMQAGALEYTADDTIEAALNRIDYNIKNVLMRKFVLEVTERCNFMCRYCFNAHTDNFRRHTSRQMSIKTACKAIDYYFTLYTDFYKRLDDKHRKLLLEHFAPSIGFYGGEPTLNFDVVENATDYLMSLPWERHGILLNKIDVTLNTNLSKIDKRLLKYATRHNVLLYVSLDGIKSYNDKHRIDALGHGTFDMAYSNLLKIKEYNSDYFRTKVSILAVETDDAPVAENHNFLDSLGCYVQYNDETPYGCFVKQPESKTANNLGEYGQKWIDSVITYISKHIKTNRKKCLARLTSLSFIEHLITDMPVNPEFRSVFISCPMGIDNIMIDVKGDMHICHKTDGSMPFGNVYSGLDRDKLAGIYSAFVKATNSLSCRRCWAFRQCHLCGAVRMKKGKFINPSDNECRYYRSETYLQFRLFIEVYKRYPELIPELFEYQRDFNNNKGIVDYNVFMTR